VTIVVGRNNAGKSTIIEALRLVSLVVNNVGGMTARDVPRWLDIAKVNVGCSPSLDNQEFNFSSVFHRYGEPPSKITAWFDSGASVVVYVGGDNRVHGVIRDSARKVVTSRSQARRLGLPRVGILPQISPVADSEIILLPEYVRKKMASTLASLHFRNQLNLLYSESFAEFRAISQATWPGLEIMELRGQGRQHETALELLVRNEDFVAEVSWMGHGLQMWLQTMWFLARCREFDTIILDEPDVYMHADLQRRLVRFLKGRHPQVIIATHSIEIMSEVEPENILVVDRERRQAQFTTDVPAVQQVVDQIGGIANLQLARLWDSRRCLFVEGKDVGLLKRFQNTLFPTSECPIDAMPNLSVGGWGGWNYAVGSAMLMAASVDRDVRSYCIFDSDFHTPNQIASRHAEAEEKGLSLHIWQRKEWENYLLVPEAIFRAIAPRVRGVEPPLSAEAIRCKLFELAGDLRDAVLDGYASEFLVENRPGGVAQANRMARDRVANWDSHDARLAFVSGKLVVARLSAWLQEVYGVAISATRIARVMRRSEIASEIIDVLSAIEAGQPL
jgi:predicted ATPase